MTEVEFRSDMTVQNIDHMGGDEAVIQAMLVSTDDALLQEEMLEQKTTYGRVNFLMKNRHGCYDSETEVLTTEGWKRWPDVTGNESFLTLNMDTNEIEVQQAEHLVRKTISGPMIQLQMAQVDALITPDHRMVAAPRVNGPWELGIYPAKDLLDRSYRIPMTGGDWIGEIHSPKLAELVGFIAADGSFTGSSIEFNLKRQRKIDWLTDRTTTREIYRTGLRYRLTDASEDLRRWAKATYTESGDRCFPREILQRGDCETIQAMLDGYLAGDGSVSATGKITCSTTSRQMVDDIQEACLKVGLAAVETAPDTTRSGSFGVRPLYRLTVYRERNAFPRIGWTPEAREEQVKVVDYEGDIHCVTVPNGTLYVRRNGKPMWCGNTPFEHAALKFFVEAPLVVFREWHRHRIGWCLSGDTRIPVGTWKNGVTKRLEDVYKDWHEGVTDSLGRTRLLPSCRNLATRTLNPDTGLIESARMVDVYQSGIKPLILVTTNKGKSIKTTRDHRFMSQGTWVKAGDLSVGDIVSCAAVVPIGEFQGIPRRLREGIQFWTTGVKSEIISVIDSCHVCGGVFPREELEVDHVIAVSSELRLALDKDNLAPICTPCHEVKSGQESWAVNRRPAALGARDEWVASIEDIEEEMTYDIEMPAPWHNFVAEGFIVHNSYNERSGRYSQLDPVYYVPADDRPLIQVGKPGAYSFIPADPETHAWLVQDMKEEAISNYVHYEARLERGIAREAARFSLGINIYSAMFATCNPRSLMAFLSLRTKEEDSKFPSYPMWEIELCARAAEETLEKLFPMVYQSFNENGRVCP